MGLEEEKSLPNITDALQNKSINPLDLGGLIFFGGEIRKIACYY